MFTANSYSIFRATVGVFALWILGSIVQAWSAIPTEKQCSATYDPARSFCTDVIRTPWRWFNTPQYGRPKDGPYDSEGEAISHSPDTFNIGGSGSWCTMTMAEYVHDFYAPDTTYGEETKRWHRAEYNVTYWQTPQSNCENQSGGVIVTISQERNIVCPPASEPGAYWSLVYDPVDAPKPYCAMRWTDVWKRCPSSPKGNPTNCMTGTKTQRETDYTGGGPFPLSVYRVFDSSEARANYYSSSATRQIDAAYGIGWAGNYFQKVTFDPTAQYPAATVVRPGGNLEYFRQSGSSFLGEDDNNARLTRQTDGGGATTGWVYTTPDQSTETFDVAGRLIELRSRTGITQTVAYNSTTEVFPASVTHSFGQQLIFGYSYFGTVRHLTSITLPGGTQITYSYDQSKDALTTVSYPGGTNRTYHYENTSPAYVNLLTGITDESGNRFATYAYHSNGRIASTEHAGGVEKYSFVYNADGSRVVTDPLGTARTYGTAIKYGARRPTTASATGSSGDSKTQTYDDFGNVTSRTDFKNSRTCYQYDTTRNLEITRVEGFSSSVTGCPSNLSSYTPATGTNERKIATAWHSTFRLPSSIVEANRTTSFTYDANGNLLSRTVTDTSSSPNQSRIWTYTYDAHGQVLTDNGPRTDVSDVTTYAYYTCTTGAQCGQLQTETNALSHITTYNSYNVHGQPTQITDTNGLITNLAYDLRQRVTHRCTGGTLPGCNGGELTILEYWPTGLLKKVTSSDGSVLTYTYDNAHRLTQIADGIGNRVVYTLDAAGNRTKEEMFDTSNYLVRSQQRAFNALNQLWKQIGSANTLAVTTTFGYDSNGNQIASSAPLGRDTATLYDELNRPKQFEDPEDGIALFGYDTNDNLTAVTDPRGKVTNYVYNGFGDLKQTTSPDTGLTSILYDEAGNLAQSTDARNKSGTRTYDALNRLTQLSYSDQSITYSYDTGANNNGRLMQVTDGSGSTSWTYTTQGRIASRTQQMGSVSKSVGYSYNTAGQLTTITTPSGQVLTYAYDNNRIASVLVNGSPLLSNVLYDSFGPPRQWTWGNNTLAERGYDQDGNIQHIDSAGLKTYGHDDAFRITSITDAENSSLDAYYAYDLADRLTDVSNEAPDTLEIGLSATTLAPGDTLTVNVIGIPPGTGYWLALARSGVSSTTYNKWVQVVPSAGNFQWNVTMPAYAGTYEVRLFANGFTLLASSTQLTVSSPPPSAQPTLTAVAGSTAPGSSVTVRLANGPAGSSHWLALALVGAPNTSYLQWTYVGNGVTNRDWTVTMPTTEDDFEFRLFLNNGYTLAAASGPVFISDDAPVSGSGPQYDHDFTYDANGNRLTGEGSTYAISSTSNRLMSVSGAITRTYTYDAAGNTTSYGGFAFGYDDASRLTSVSGGASATYSHNALGQRVRRTFGGTTNYFVYDEVGRLIGEYDGSGNLIQETVWLEDAPVATLRPNGGSVSIYFVHTDHLNSPRRVSRPSDDEIVWRWDSGPFGTGAANQDPDGDSSAFIYNLRYPGQIFDLETGLNYNYFRDYDPTVGRYVQSDPIGIWGGLNTYLYAAANPVSFSDRRGHSPAAGVLAPAAPALGGLGGTLTGSVGAAGAGTVAGGVIIAGGLGYGGGWLFNQGLNRILEWGTGTTFGGLIYDMCNDSEDEKRCKAVERGCKIGCSDIYADDRDKLPGAGSDYASRWRICVRECMQAQGCYNF